MSLFLQIISLGTENCIIFLQSGQVVYLSGFIWVLQKYVFEILFDIVIGDEDISEPDIEDASSNVAVTTSSKIDAGDVVFLTEIFSFDGIFSVDFSIWS